MSGRYSNVHRDPQGAGDARPTAQQIIHDEAVNNKWEDKTVLITGVSSGIGITTAQALATTGARLFLTVRNLDKGRKALNDLLSNRVQLVEMDNGSLASVRKGAQDFLSRAGNKLNVLICNAGIMSPPTRQLSTDGFEEQFAVNHLAHFLLFQLVKDALLSSTTKEFNSRVVMLSSSGHTYGQVNFEDYNIEQGYDAHSSYGQSKVANIYMSNHIERLYGP